MERKLNIVDVQDYLYVKSLNSIIEDNEEKLIRLVRASIAYYNIKQVAIAEILDVPKSIISKILYGKRTDVNKDRRFAIIYAVLSMVKALDMVKEIKVDGDMTKAIDQISKIREAFLPGEKQRKQFFPIK